MGGMTIHRSNPGSDLTGTIIRLAMRVHRTLGPGLLESIYLQCLCWELKHAGVRFTQEVPLPVVYRDMRLERGFRADLIVDDSVLVELKAVDRILPVHKAQTLTYLRLSGCPVGLLMNFNVDFLRHGLHRVIL